MHTNLSLSLCLSLIVSRLSSATICTGQAQTVPRCPSQRPGQRAAEEEEESGAAQHQDSAPSWGEDSMTCDINMHLHNALWMIYTFVFLFCDTQNEVHIAFSDILAHSIHKVSHRSGKYILDLHPFQRKSSANTKATFFTVPLSQHH